MKKTEAKCPFRFRKCNDKCALRVKTKTYYHETYTTAIGHTCSFAAMASNIVGPLHAAQFVDEPKIVEGQEPIGMAKNNCTLTYNGEISGTDAPSYVCSVCGYEENLDTAKFCGGCGLRVANISETVKTVSEAKTTKKRCHDIETNFNGFEWVARCKKCGSRVCGYTTEDKAINALEDMPCR